jgi:hypothetical protein
MRKDAAKQNVREIPHFLCAQAKTLALGASSAVWQAAPPTKNAGGLRVL